MDGHFDFDQFHPTFLGDDGWSHYGGFGDYFHVSMDNFLQQAYEFHLPTDVLHHALEDACRFIGIPDMDFVDSPFMAVDNGDPNTYEDDKLLFSRQQMENMGIHDEKSLSLICTHEVGHRLLQYMQATNQLSTWQTELACDAIMGVRSVVDNIDITPIKESLHNTYDDPSHPGFGLRYEYIDIGREIGQYLIDHDLPANADNIMSRLREYINDDSSRVLNMEKHVNQLLSLNPQAPTIAAFTKEDVDFYAHQARITGSQTWIDRYNWAVSHLSGYTSPADIPSPEEWSNPDLHINKLSSLDPHAPNISAFTKEDVDFYAHQARITGSQTWVDRYNWAVSHLSGFTSPTEHISPEDWLKKVRYPEGGWHVLDGPNGQA